MGARFARFAQAVSDAAGSPWAFGLALFLVGAWALSGPFLHFSEVWQLTINTGTTIITFLMVFLIQNAQNRDASAIQSKLDELIRALDGARNEFIGIEHRTQSELERIRHSMEAEFGVEAPHAATIDRLLDRR